MRRSAAALAWLLVLPIACATFRHRPSEPERADCRPDAETRCRAQCGGQGARRDTREGHCEAVLHDLCHARCLKACGDESSWLEKQIGAYESSLEHDCGSGTTVKPGEAPAPPVPTPHLLDQLML